MEVYMFAETEEPGRFLRIEETTLMLKGTESDRDLGSAKLNTSKQQLGPLFAHSSPSDQSICPLCARSGCCLWCHNSRARKKPLNGGLYADDAFRDVQ